MSWVYDLVGNLTGDTTSRGTTGYAYDDANQLTSMTPPGPATTRFAYNADGLRSDTWWKSNAAHTTFAAHTHTDYDTTGRIAGAPGPPRNNSDATKVFDTTLLLRRRRRRSALSASPPQRSNPPKGLIQWSQDNPHHTRPQPSTPTTSEPAHQRLKLWPGLNCSTYAYTYDLNGNRKTATKDGVQSQNFRFNAGNQISSRGYAYDLAGNATTDPSAGTMTYDGAGQMTAQDGSIYTRIAPTTSTPAPARTSSSPTPSPAATPPSTSMAATQSTACRPSTP